MPRLTKLDDVLFPVEEHPVFVGVQTKSSEQRLSVPDKKAIVDVKNHRVLGVVGQDYRLVTNRQALEWAHQCCRAVFPETKESEWEVAANDAPGTGGHCFIDLAHNSTSLDFHDVAAKDRPDAYGPFIRVTNSYNRLRALAFDIGFLRKVWKNGMIAQESIIQFRLAHPRRDIREAISFEVSQDRLARLKARFTQYLGILRGCAVARAEFEPLVCAALLIRAPQDAMPGSLVEKDWHALSEQVASLCTRYEQELGANAYAVLNAITEFASHPPRNRCVHRNRHSFQRLAGDWLSRFSHDCRQPGFTVPRHLAELAKHDGGRGEATRRVRPQGSSVAVDGG